MHTKWHRITPDVAVTLALQGLYFVVGAQALSSTIATPGRVNGSSLDSRAQGYYYYSCLFIATSAVVWEPP